VRVNETPGVPIKLTYLVMGEKVGDEEYQKKAQEFVTKLVEFHEKNG